MNNLFVFLCMLTMFGCAHSGDKKWRTRDRKNDIEKESKRRSSLDHQGRFYYFVPLYFSKID